MESPTLVFAGCGMRAEMMVGAVLFPHFDRRDVA